MTEDNEKTLARKLYYCREENEKLKSQLRKKNDQLMAASIRIVDLQNKLKFSVHTK